MKVTDIEGLYVATNADYNFTILVIAKDKFNAETIAENYFGDVDMNTGNIKVQEFSDVNTRFDCNHVMC